MSQNADTLRHASKLLWLTALVIAVVYLLNESAILSIAYSPSVLSFNHTLASVLQWIQKLIAGLTALPVSGVSAVAAFVLGRLAASQETGE